MSRTYVAIDLETTGLDPKRDAIIEVGAVRFELNGSHETFGSFIDPKRGVPYRVQRLTKIVENDLKGAPQFAEVAAELEAFIGDNAVVGQNISFDLGFLEAYGLTPPGPAYDTHELANMLLPELLDRSLSGIARHLGVTFPVQHRALADAQATGTVFLALRERLAGLPGILLDEAARIASRTDWPLRHLLSEVLEERPLLQPEDLGLVHGVVRAPGAYGRPVGAGADDGDIDADEIEQLLTSGAPDVVDQFEERPEQVAMARAVTATLGGGGELLVEAGTGTGKSLAYLIPAAVHALSSDARVVISTNTINLQEQLVGQDIPAVERLVGQDGSLRSAQLKGRRNYLCLLRWANARRSTGLSTAEAKLLVRLLLWLPHSDSGDRAELRLAPNEEALWSRLSAQHESCLAAPCAFVRDGSCFLLRARKRAEAAHLLVVNHALLLSDIGVGGGVIPEYRHVVIDEAQHLESEATDQFGFAAQEGDLTTLLDRTAGMLGSLRSGARPAGGRGIVDARGVEDAVARSRDEAPRLFRMLQEFVQQQSTGPNDYGERLRLTRSMRVQPDWANVETAWESLSGAIGALLVALGDLHDELQAAGAEEVLEIEERLSELVELRRSVEELREGVGGVISRDDPAVIAWLTQDRAGNGISLAAAPLRVSEILRERLFSQKEATILTSATLTSEDRFDYIRTTLGLPEADELLLGSPFDYASSTLALVPQDMPEPNQSGYMAAVQQALIELARASRGRALVLFTSHASLRAAYDGIKGPLEDEGILVLGQLVDGSPKAIIQALRDEPQTVVLGTSSFWEGVDIVGEALSLLVITRLPFSVPSDPVFQARSELYDNPFTEYTVPQAVLRFKQGFGRLIRRKSDRGVLVALDARLYSKAYGAAFLTSLPPCTIRRVPAREMHHQVAAWLEGGR